MREPPGTTFPQSVAAFLDPKPPSLPYNLELELQPILLGSPFAESSLTTVELSGSTLQGLQGLWHAEVFRSWGALPKEALGLLFLIPPLSFPSYEVSSFVPAGASTGMGYKAIAVGAHEL